MGRFPRIKGNDKSDDLARQGSSKGILGVATTSVRFHIWERLKPSDNLFYLYQNRCLAIDLR